MLLLMNLIRLTQIMFEYGEQAGNGVMYCRYFSGEGLPASDIRVFDAPGEGNHYTTDPGAGAGAKFHKIPPKFCILKFFPDERRRSPC
ncbi:MAG: hypothetical protein JSU77_05015 [Fidelibacterota bacterium]|nr:MAG: hypothetical protein JSU77_05015 [Candidatus Neomarinimicrobiota bacterium]